MRNRASTQEKDDWDKFVGRVELERGTFFGRGAPIWCSRAPGRLDVIGGVADYSGSLVLESTLAQGTMAAAQFGSDDLIRVRSTRLGLSESTRECDIDSGFLRSVQGPVSIAEARVVLTMDSSAKWAAYAAGCLYMLCEAGYISGRDLRGVNLWVESDVPIGAGVSSSAALEVSVMTALAPLFGVELDGLEMARLCQRVENEIVGAPCGIMDQVTCALGREGTLLKLKCQPHDVRGHEELPQGWFFVGLDSAVKHSVGGRAYSRARVGAFMGLAIIESLAGRKDSGYLCNLSPAEWEEIRDRIPETITGAEFSELYGSSRDTVSRIDPDEIYRVRANTEHPILENTRVEEFARILQAARNDGDESLLMDAGRLMYEAHESYSQRVDLGSEETDLLVDIGRTKGPDRGIYGAKITGGGSGGTVAFLCTDEGLQAVGEVAAEYESRTGLVAGSVGGSSPGAVEFGVHKLE